MSLLIGLRLSISASLTTLSCLVASVSPSKATPFIPSKLSSILVLTPPEPKSPGSVRLGGLLDGLGISYHKRAVSDESFANAGRYDLVIAIPGFLSEVADRKILNKQLKDAIDEGVDVIYIGPSFCGNADSELFSLFRFPQSDKPCLSKAGDLNKRSIDLTSFGLGSRTLLLQADEEVIAPHSDSGSRDVFVRTTSGMSKKGSRVLIGFDILSFWKHPESDSAFLRPLLLTRIVNRHLVNGYAAKHSSMNGQQSPFLMRWEDVSPVPSSDTSLPLIENLERLASILNQYQIPLNIAIVSHFVDPLKGIQSQWSDISAANQSLKKFIKSQLLRRGSLIAHGYTHQYGDTPNDRSKLDGEMWDESTGAYLSIVLQRQKVRMAKDAIIQDWQQIPLIWETPHYQSNSDTYQAVADEGFLYVVESDSTVFPNRSGYDNNLDRRLLNLPETAYEIPLDEDQIRERLDLWSSAIQPDLYEIGAPFLFFYHGISNSQFKALQKLLQSTPNYDYWKPNLLEFAQFWERRANVQHVFSHDRQSRKISLRVNNAFVGYTIRFRVPNSYLPGFVTANGKRHRFTSRQFDNNWYVYVALTKSGDQFVTLNYRPAT